ncbi:unnamed protein product [Pedinophyceae sp. YPF-701]|nr:unnamed protein product [Pedinophyceae sp. YPF-701]
MDPKSYNFKAAWLDPVSGVEWSFLFTYHRETAKVELYDVKNRRAYLKPALLPTGPIPDDRFFLGAKLMIFGRSLELVDFADDETRSALAKQLGRTLAMIKPDAVHHAGEILTDITKAGFRVKNMRMCRLSRAEAEEFYSVHRGKPFYPTLVDYMTSGRIVALELLREDAIKAWRDLIGPTDAAAAREEAPASIRARFGTDKTRNACHGSDAPETAAQEVEFFFGAGRGSVGKCCVNDGSTTLGIIKPHAFLDGRAGSILQVIQAQFDVTALQLVSLNRTDASEFYEVYRGVVPPDEFSDMLEEITSGPFLALEVAPGAEGADTVESFRQLCGPRDPDLARLLRQETIRAVFGQSRAKNAVHCTDLEEDAGLEVQYFFELIV